MKKLSKFLSILLCLSMIIGFLPSIARAEDTTTISVTISDYATANGWTNGTQYSTLVMDDVVTVTASGTTNTGKYYTSGPDWRIYQSESPSIVVSAKDTTIVSVKITYTPNNNGVLTYNSGNITSATVVAVDAASATFGVGNTGTATNGQVRITAIEVVYVTPSNSDSDTTCTHEYDSCEDTICNLCQEERTALEHKYDSCLDTDCNTCGATREALEHEYTDDLDPSCNACGATRAITLTIPQANELGAAQTSYTADKYYVTGVITEVYNTTYGNMYITDDEGNVFTVYGTYSADGSTRYDKLEVKPVAGDTVTVYGVIGQYNGAAQMKNGWITEHIPKPCDHISTTLSYISDTTHGLVCDGCGNVTETANHSFDNGDCKCGYHEYVTDPETDVAYKLGLYQGSKETYLYPTGKMDGYYLATTETIAEGVNVYLAEAEGGYYLYCIVDGATKYIDIYVNGTYVNIGFKDEPTAVYTWDDVNYTLVTTVNDTDYYIGTYSSYNTLSASKISYISTSFPTHLYTLTTENCNHSWADATCTAPKTCSVCGSTDGESLGHSWADATCTAPKTCSVCGATDGEALGHSYDDGVVTTAPTCTATGVKTYTCTVCGDSYTETVDSLGHSWNDGEVTTAPTCSAAGVKTYTCTVCGESKTEEIAIDAEAHDWDSGVITTAPTCSAVGVKTYTCKHDASHSRTEEIAIDASAHVDEDNDGICDLCEETCCAHEYTEAVTAPTCTAKGYTTYSCKHCTYSYVDNYVNEQGHSYDDGVVTTAPTCTTAGVKTISCTACDHSYTESVAALGHDYDDGVVTTEPTCTEAGVKTYTCAHDATHTYTEPVTALGHSYDDGAITAPPTCTEAGIKTYTCDHDASHTYTESVKALGHSLKKVEEVPATTEATGLKEHYKCETCGKLFSDENGTTEVTLADLTIDKLVEEDDTLSATIVFDNVSKRTEFTAEKQVWTENGVTVTNNKAASTNDVADYYKPARFYKDSDLTIAFEDMQVIIFNCNGSKYTEALKAALTGTDYTVTVDGNTITVTLNAAADTFTVSLSGGQVRLDSITVATGAVEDDTTDDDTTTSTDPEADSTLTVKEAIDLGSSKDHNTYTEGKYYVTGVITEVYNTTYGNMKITDENGNVLTVYGTFSADGTVRYDAMDVKPVAGDTVTVYGVIGQYNGVAQMKNGWIVKHDVAVKDDNDTTDDDTTTSTDPEADSTLTVKEAIDLGSSKDHNTYTEGKYYVTGVITEVYNTTYGNMKITDENGNVLTVYGTFNADGTVRYDAMDVKPVAGDTVTVYGVIGQYNGVAQMKNGWIVKHDAAVKDDDTTTDDDTSIDDDTTAPSETTKPTETVQKAEKVTAPTAGKCYKLGYYQANLDETLYFAGTMDGYYLATTSDLNKAVDVYVESVKGGLRLYFLDGSTKTYIDIVPRESDATKTNVILTTTPTAVYVWNETFGTFVTTVNDADWYLGTYSNYNTISASKTSYIEDTSKIGVSQFPVCCYEVKEVPKTGDSISVFVALLAMSAIGIAIIGLKKKEF